MWTHDYKKFNLGLGNIMSCFAGSPQSGPDLTLNGPLLGQSPTVASVCFLSGSFLPPCTCQLLCPQPVHAGSSSHRTMELNSPPLQIANGSTALFHVVPNTFAL